MNSCRKLLIVIISSVVLLQGCAGTPVSMGVSNEFDRAAFDMENPRKLSISASGFQLLLFIPISINSRHARAYSALEAQAGEGLISDVQVTESWTYGFVGTVYKTTIDANVYPRKKP